MAKSKKPASKKVSKAHVKRKSVQQQIWRIQNKLDQKRLQLSEKRELEKKLRQAKNKIGYKEPTKREVERYKKERKYLSSKKSKLEKELKDPNTTGKRRNQVVRELNALSSRKKEISKNLGEKVEKAPKKEEPEIIESGVVVNEVLQWFVKPDYLDPVIDMKSVDTFIIATDANGLVSIDKSNPDEVYDQWYILQAEGIAKYGNYAVIVIVEDVNNRSMELYLKEEE